MLLKQPAPALQRRRHALRQQRLQHRQRFRPALALLLVAPVQQHQRWRLGQGGLWRGARPHHRRMHAGAGQAGGRQQGGVERLLLAGGEGQGEPVALLAAGPRQGRQGHPRRGRRLGVARRPLQGFPRRKHQAEQHRRRRCPAQVPCQPQQLEGQQAVGQPGRHLFAAAGRQGQLLLQPPRQHQRPAQLPPLLRIAIAAAAEHAAHRLWPARFPSRARSVHSSALQPAAPRAASSGRFTSPWWPTVLA